MVECYKCGQDKSASEMFDVIAKEGVVKICSDCIKNEDLPVIRRPTSFQLKEAEQTSGIYERLSKMAGLNPNEHFKKFHKDSSSSRKITLRQPEITLRDLVDRKKGKMPILDSSSSDDLIKNFHWILMRARRMKKLTITKVARDIGESEAAIQMMERGVVPAGSGQLIRKLESYLGIKLYKGDAVLFSEGSKKIGQKNVGFGKFSSGDLTISDIKKMQAEYDTNLMSEEIDEDIAMNEEGAEKLKEEGKKKGFFSRLFGGGNKDE